MILLSGLSYRKTRIYPPAAAGRPVERSRKNDTNFERRHLLVRPSAAPQQGPVRLESSPLLDALGFEHPVHLHQRSRVLCRARPNSLPAGLCDVSAQHELLQATARSNGPAPKGSATNDAEAKPPSTPICSFQPPTPPRFCAICRWAWANRFGGLSPFYSLGVIWQGTH